jgi:hypothetical protein
MLEPVFPDSKTFKCEDLYLLTVGTEAGKEILETCHEIAHMLVKKNIAYGNSALDPINIFSKASALEQLSTRIDDKLNRVKRGSEYPGDDTILDLIGYLVLYRISSHDNKNMIK